MNGEACETGNFAPQTHELLSYAATQLFAQNQKSLELRDSHGSYHPSIKDTPEGAVSNGQGDTPRPLGGTVSRAKAVPAGPGYSYAHASRTRFGDQQSDPFRKKQIQVNYLDCLAARIPAPSSFHDELQTKEKLRVQLTTIAQKALERYAQDNGYTIGPRAIDLKCFGSLRNGFMLPNADLDLVVKTHASSFPRELEKVCPHVLEKAFLDAGFGARLLSNTRVPIIKLCEKPPKQFLGTLKQEHARRQTKEAQRLSGTKIGFQSDLSAPPNTLHSCRRRASFDFPQSDVGLRCEINFSGRLALYNTELLRCYALCDERVRFLGVFVKMWAKNRKINDPHDGTLCSYGYILMVVHYLMNVAYPPVSQTFKPSSDHFQDMLRSQASMDTTSAFLMMKVNLGQCPNARGPPAIRSLSASFFVDSLRIMEAKVIVRRRIFIGSIVQSRFEPRVVFSPSMRKVGTLHEPMTMEIGLGF